MGPFFCLELEPMYLNLPVCLHGIGHMRIHCQMDLFGSMELEYMEFIVKWAWLFAWNHNTYKVNNPDGPVCLYGI